MNSCGLSTEAFPLPVLPHPRRVGAFTQPAVLMIVVSEA